MTRYEYKVLNTAGLVSRWTRKGTEKDIAVLEAQMNELNKRVAETWRHLHSHGCGTLAELADDLGITPNQLSAHLSTLRKRWGSKCVPKGKPGRRSHRLAADR